MKQWWHLGFVLYSMRWHSKIDWHQNSFNSQWTNEFSGLNLICRNLCAHGNFERAFQFRVQKCARRSVVVDFSKSMWHKPCMWQVQTWAFEKSLSPAVKFASSMWQCYTFPISLSLNCHTGQYGETNFYRWSRTRTISTTKVPRAILSIITQSNTKQFFSRPCIMGPSMSWHHTKYNRDNIYSNRSSDSPHNSALIIFLWSEYSFA